MSLFLKTDKADRRRFLRSCSFVQGLREESSAPPRDFQAPLKSYSELPGCQQVKITLAPVSVIGPVQFAMVVSERKLHWKRPEVRGLQPDISCFGWLDFASWMCDDISAPVHHRPFSSGLQFPAPCSMGEWLCPWNWLTEGYFPNDSVRSWPEMNDLLYFKWQTGCFHSTLAPGSATIALFSGSRASVIKRGGGGFTWIMGSEENISGKSKL